MRHQAPFFLVFGLTRLGIELRSLGTLHIVTECQRNQWIRNCSSIMYLKVSMEDDQFPME